MRPGVSEADSHHRSACMSYRSLWCYFQRVSSFKAHLSEAKFVVGIINCPLCDVQGSGSCSCVCRIRDVICQGSCICCYGLSIVSHTAPAWQGVAFGKQDRYRSCLRLLLSQKYAQSENQAFAYFQYTKPLRMLWQLLLICKSRADPKKVTLATSPTSTAIVRSAKSAADVILWLLSSSMLSSFILAI